MTQGQTHPPCSLPSPPHPGTVLPQVRVALWPGTLVGSEDHVCCGLALPCRSPRPLCGWPGSVRSCWQPRACVWFLQVAAARTESPITLSKGPSCGTGSKRGPRWSVDVAVGVPASAALSHPPTPFLAPSEAQSLCGPLVCSAVTWNPCSVVTLGAPVAARLPDPQVKVHGALLSARRGLVQTASPDSSPTQRSLWGVPRPGQQAGPSTGGWGSAPPPPPLCGLASFACPQKPHSRGICPVGPHAHPGVLAPILSKESQGLYGQHVTQFPC